MPTGKRFANNGGTAPQKNTGAGRHAQAPAHKPASKAAKTPSAPRAGSAHAAGTRFAQQPAPAQQQGYWYAGEEPSARYIEQAQSQNQAQATISARRARRESIKKAGEKRTALIAGLAAALVLVIYIAGCVFFAGKFYPNTVIGGADVSMMGASEATAALHSVSGNHTVSVAGQGVTFTVDSRAAGYEVDADAAVTAAMAEYSSLLWPVQVWGSHDSTDVLAANFDTVALRSTVEAQLAAHNRVAQGPVDAYIYYDRLSGAFAINPGSTGNMLDVDRVLGAVTDAMVRQESYAPLTSDHLVPQAVLASDERLAQALDAANAHLDVNLDLTVYGEIIASVDADVVNNWVVVGSDFSVYLDDAKLTAWVDTVEATADTVGDTRTYTRPDGKVITVTGGSYGWVSDGWALDEIVRQAVYNGTVGMKEIPFYQSGSTFNPGGQDWGLRYVDIDITEQAARFYDYDGSLVRQCYVITGETSVPDRATPEGVWYITTKAMNQTLIGLDDPETGEPLYETPVTYWMPFVENMVGLHDASWQSTFGGNLYQIGLGSHGCVNLPVDVAAWCYGWINVGDVVVTHY